MHWKIKIGYARKQNFAFSKIFEIAFAISFDISNAYERAILNLITKALRSRKQT